MWWIESGPRRVGATWTARKPPPCFGIRSSRTNPEPLPVRPRDLPRSQPSRFALDGRNRRHIPPIPSRLSRLEPQPRIPGTARRKCPNRRHIPSYPFAPRITPAKSAVLKSCKSRCFRGKPFYRSRIHTREVVGSKPTVPIARNRPGPLIAEAGGQPADADLWSDGGLGRDARPRARRRSPWF